MKANITFVKTTAMDSDKETKLRELLDQHHDWPDSFVFKFIYKSGSDTEEKLKSLFPKNAEFTIKSSTKNKFNSMTVNHISSGADEIFAIYKSAGEIEGVISL